MQDFKDATKVIAVADQNDLGLPDRDYYTKQDDKSKELRQTYTLHVERMMKLAGSSATVARAQAADVMRIETALAEARDGRRDARSTGLYNLRDHAALRAMAAFQWDDYLKALGLSEAGALNVTAPHYFETIGKLLASEKPSAWQAYLAWTVVRSVASLLGKPFAEERFALEAALTGQKEEEARWKRCIDATGGALGELAAQPFLKRAFSPASKQAADRFVHEIGAAFSREVAKLDWMDAATKARADEKRKAMAYLIGYPTKWRVYDFEVKAKSYADNVLAARAWNLRRHLGKVGKPVDRDEWAMNPQDVDAYYSAQRNQMVFPAGILQPPFFSAMASIPVNLGGMGMVVGHELTHGFDDQGAQFDGSGNLASWWTPDVEAKFKARTTCVADQYAEYEAIPGVKLNGRLTLGENIADGGGVKLAFAAYRAMRAGASEVVKAEGFTEDQQFFLGFQAGLVLKQSDEVARMGAQVDPHSPSRFRVNGPLSNLPEFSRAFGCRAGTPMRRANACGVW